MSLNSINKLIFAVVKCCEFLNRLYYEDEHWLQRVNRDCMLSSLSRRNFNRYCRPAIIYSLTNPLCMEKRNPSLETDQDFGSVS
jgi:hypothetical protein